MKIRSVFFLFGHSENIVQDGKGQSGISKLVCHSALAIAAAAVGAVT